MRDYPHDPDGAFMERQYHRKVQGISTIRDTIARDGPSDSLIGMLLVDAGWAVGYGWALGKPIDQLRDVLRPGIDGLRTGLAAGIRPDRFRLWTMLPVPIIAGDRDGAMALARLATELELSDPPNDTVDHGYQVLAALALEDVDAARRHADAITAHLARVETPPDIAEAMEGLDRMAIAVLDDDQAAFDRAGDDRAAVQARVYAGSVEQRRHVFGVFDFPGAALCRFAHVAGMDLPDRPIYAADLVREL